MPQNEAREILELPQDGLLLSVFGALAGAKSLNEFVAETWAESGPPILHVTGRRDFESVRRQVKRDDYRVIAEAERFGAVISAADLVLARSGSTVWEVAAAGRPAIFVPYPFATGTTRRATPSISCAQAARSWSTSWTSTTCPELVRSLLDDPERRKRMSEEMLRVARPDAAAEIADELIAMARNGAKRSR